MSQLGKLNLKDVAGAVLSGAVMAILTYLSSLTSIFSVDWQSLVNVAILAAVTSLLKSLSTDESGKVLGVLSVK